MPGDAVERGTVLIVDDSPLDIAVHSEILRANHRVLSAADPESAFDLLRSGLRPDLVLLDVMMPGKDGLAFCRQLKAIPATAAVPIVFLTAKDSTADEEAGFAAGAVDYVAKPVDPHLLAARVRTHVELKKARENLEEQNQALREAVRLREEIEQINRHDLKNPLMIMMNIPGLLKSQSNLTADQKKWLEMIEEAARRMLEMINRSIDLAKMERGTYALVPVAVDALSIARRIVAAFSHEAFDRTVRLELFLNGKSVNDSDAFTIRGEELLLYSMLANLVRNALEASPPGSVLIDFKSGSCASISVHNQGTIPPEIRGRFFEKFATFGKKSGTGLGAYSARLAATTLGGSISFASSEQEGTTITVTLPRNAQ